MTPTTPDSGDATSVEVGVKFRSEAPARSPGFRFYKAAANTGTHVGSLWTASGQLLASATFTNETASGWQTVTFRTPVDDQPRTRPTSPRIWRPTGITPARLATSIRLRRRPARRRRRSTARPLHAISNTGASTNGVYAIQHDEHFPDQHVRRRELLGRPGLRPPRCTRSGHVGRRDRKLQGRHGHVVGTIVGWTGDVLHRHAVHRLDGTDPDDRLAARDKRHVHRADSGQHLHVHGASLQRDR